MATMVYKSEAVYEIQNAGNGHCVYLYVERQNAEYQCIAYNPDNNRMISHCCFVEPFKYDMDSAVSKAVKMMQIQHINIKRIKRQVKAVDMAQEPDIKVQLLKTLADEVHPQDYKSDIMNNILEIIKML